MRNNILFILCLLFPFFSAGNPFADSLSLEIKGKLSITSPMYLTSLEQGINRSCKSLSLRGRIYPGPALGPNAYLDVIVNGESIGRLDSGNAYINSEITEDKNLNLELRLGVYGSLEPCEYADNLGAWCAFKIDQLVLKGVKEEVNPLFIGHAVQGITALVVPDNAPIQHYGKIANLAFRLEGLSGNQIQILNHSQAQEAKLNNYAFFGTRQDLPKELEERVGAKNKINLGIVEVVPMTIADSAYLGEDSLQYPLVITGYTDEGLEKAYNACLKQGLLESTLSHQLYLSNIEKVQPVVSAVTWHKLSNFTAFTGRFHVAEEVGVDVNFSRGDLIFPKGKAQVVLKGSHGPINDANAYISIELNGKQIGLQNLEKEGGDFETKARFSTQELRSQNRIEIKLIHRNFEGPCGNQSKLDLWLNMDESALVYMGSDEGEWPRLSMFPGALLQEAPAIVYSANYGLSTSKTLYALIKGLNQNPNLNQAVFPKTINSAEYRSNDYKSSNKIYLLERSDSLLIQELNEVFQLRGDTVILPSKTSESVEVKLHPNEILAQIYSDRNRHHLMILSESSKIYEIEALVDALLLDPSKGIHPFVKARGPYVEFFSGPLLISDLGLGGTDKFKTLRFWSKNGVWIGFGTLALFVIILLYLNRTVFKKAS